MIYFVQGRPVLPQAGVYKIANALALRRSLALRDMLEALLSRWQAVQDRVVIVADELDRLEDAINAAADVVEVAAALSGAWE